MTGWTYLCMEMFYEKQKHQSTQQNRLRKEYKGN